MHLSRLLCILRYLCDVETAHLTRLSASSGLTQVDSPWCWSCIYRVHNLLKRKVMFYRKKEQIWGNYPAQKTKPFQISSYTLILPLRCMCKTNDGNQHIELSCLSLMRVWDRFQQQVSNKLVPWKLKRIVQFICLHTCFSREIDLYLITYAWTVLKLFQVFIRPVVTK